MQAPKPHGSRWIIAGAMVVGFLAGCVLMSIGQARPNFLGNSSPITQRDEATSGGQSTISYFSVPEDWKQVIVKATKELPNAFVHDTLIAGMRAKVLTVPRIENGRLQMFYPPDEEITFMPHRFAMNTEGHVVALKDLNHAWTGVQMRVFRQPRPIDNLIEWVHKNLKV